jgi:hypothetical protein
MQDPLRELCREATRHSKARYSSASNDSAVDLNGNVLQEVTTSAEREATLQRKEFLAKPSLCTAIRAAEKPISSDSDKIDIRLTTVGNKRGKYGVYVNAESGVQKGAIRLAPIIKGMENRAFKGASPHAIGTYSTLKPTAPR